MKIHRIGSQKNLPAISGYFRYRANQYIEKERRLVADGILFCADLIDRIEQNIDGPDMWIWSSHDCFSLSFRDTHLRIDESVRVEPFAWGKGALISCWMNPQIATWPYARITAQTQTLDVAVKLVKHSIEHTKFIVDSQFNWNYDQAGWPKEDAYRAIYEKYGDRID